MKKVEITPASFLDLIQIAERDGTPYVFTRTSSPHAVPYVSTLGLFLVSSELKLGIYHDLAVDGGVRYYLFYEGLG